MKPASSRGQHQEPTNAGIESRTVKKLAQTPTLDESRTLTPPPPGAPDGMHGMSPPPLERTGAPASSSTPHVPHSSSACSSAEALLKPGRCSRPSCKRSSCDALMELCSAAVEPPPLPPGRRRDAEKTDSVWRGRPLVTGRPPLFLFWLHTRARSRECAATSDACPLI
jgi:hypothetical protein